MNTREATVVSECGKIRVEIERRPGGSLQVTAYKWNEEWVEGYGKVAEFWERIPQSVTVTDTLERAGEFAREKLLSFGQA